MTSSFLQNITEYIMNGSHFFLCGCKRDRFWL